MDDQLPWERLLWSARALWPSRARYALTDFRLRRVDRPDEILLDDVGDVEIRRTSLDRLLGTGTLVVSCRDRRREPFHVHHIRRSSQIAALVALLAGDPRPAVDEQAVRAALAWSPPSGGRGAWRMAAGLGAGFVAVCAVAIGLRGESPAVTFPADDAVYPAGIKRERAEIVRFMETDVMPWARETLAPLVGNRERVTCATCHGLDPESREWRMPGVSALPEPDFRFLGWETHSAGMDAQMRNAIYGYLAESDNQARAAYMRKVVMPGMARLLRRPAYDFTRSYDYNRSRFAFGCYHCHRVGS